RSVAVLFGHVVEGGVLDVDLVGERGLPVAAPVGPEGGDVSHGDVGGAHLPADTCPGLFGTIDEDGVEVQPGIVTGDQVQCRVAGGAEVAVLDGEVAAAVDQLDGVEVAIAAGAARVALEVRAFDVER